MIVILLGFLIAWIDASYFNLEIVSYILAILIGLSLGLMGGGGSILTVPVLVYTAGVAPTNATAYSLFIVGVVALIGGLRNIKNGNFDKKSAMIFGPISIIAVYATRAFIVPAIPNVLYTSGDFELSKDTFTMLFFGLVMFAASYSMIKGRKESGGDTNKLTLLLSGVFTGLVAGFAGAGGGFLIIPSLVFFAALDMKKAVGTSLTIISMQSLIGFFLGDALSGLEIDWKLLAIFSGMAFLGLIAGMKLAKQVNSSSLKKSFGYFIAAMAVFILGKEIFGNW